MTIKIEFPREIEASLAAFTAEHRIALLDYLKHLLEEQVIPHRAASLSPAERARLWRESAKGLPYTQPVSNEAVGRESFYDAN
jgi:hypothetical protein